MRRELKQIRERHALQMEDLRALFATSALLSEQTSDLRERCRETRNRRLNRTAEPTTAEA